MEKNLLILGAGEFGEVVREIAEEIGEYSKIEFLDDLAICALGKLDEYARFTDEFSDAIVAIDDPFLRMKYTEKIHECGYYVPIMVHPTAFVSRSAKIGMGTVIEPLAVVNTASKVGVACILAPSATVNHHATVCDAVHLGANSTVLSNTMVPAGTKTISGQVYSAETDLRNTNAWMPNYSFDAGV